ncbi:PAS domain S-box protein [Heyndrickxia acidicola]|uniref:histidine kinase n=1 Tax=Heyndrickxia acidicola TaxID=209389 RepID=A0ABU6MEW7_9BACI|nr:PAS domain S-box protein [Heyndrickxia acidicola]MED1203045.1 PAS domain S-box protein [Heyndrickxia acidicola]
MEDGKSEYNPTNIKLLDEMEELKQENEKLILQLNAYQEKIKNYTKSEKKFEQLFNNISDAVYYLKLDDDGNAGEFIEVNEVAYRRLGYTREEMLRMFPSHIDIHEKEELRDILKRINSNESITFETMHICKDGSRIPVEIKTHILRVDGEKFTLSVCRDISERKQAERVIQNTRKQYQRLVESSTNGIAILQDERWVFINEAGKKLFGAETKEQLLGKSVDDMLLPEFHDDYRRLAIKACEQTRFISVWKTLDGREIHTEMVLIPIIYKGKLADQLIIQDLTERKKAEELLIQAEKMNLVSQLAAGIAHEIRNPLTSLKGFVQLFHSGTVPNRQFLKIMKSELDRIDVISSEFLALAKPYNSDFTTINMQDLLENAVALLDRQASKSSVKIVTRLAKERMMVRGINTDLKKVFINLIKNAIEASSCGGTVTIKGGNKDEAVRISIQDKGIGMAEEQLTHLGDPFFTTKETGTGLGLMVTYKIIDNHHGDVRVKSKVNEGTTFTVILPAAN